MKITRIDIEGPRGRACIFRSGSDIVVNVTRLAGRPDAVIRRGTSRQDSWLVSAASPGQQRARAFDLQVVLDGHAGTAGDVADYLRVIETFAD